MARITNKQVRQHVERLQQFNTNNGTIYAEHRKAEDGSLVYVVYSYGEHWPLFAAIKPATTKTDTHRWYWFANSDPTPSPTTTRHRGYALPYLYERNNAPTITQTPLSHLKQIITEGWQYAARKRITGDI